jgi:hypothetical protein
VAEAFDRAGLRLNSSGATTVYQAPTDPGAGTSLVLSLLAAHRSSNGTEASLEITIASAAGQTLATPVQRQAIGPGMAIELMPNRVVLLPGERLRAKSSPGGVVDLMTSVLAPELLGNRRGIPSMEVYARYLPPDTVGTDQNVVELPAAVAVNVNFEEPAVLTGFAVQVPPTGADVSFPETVVLIQGIPFGAVTVEPAGLSLELQAEVPFIQAGSAPFFVPAAGIELAAAAPTVATGASVSPPALALGISAVAPEAVGPPTGDPDFASVSLLLPFDGADGSTVFTDESSNNLTITRVGTPVISTTQSKWGGSSAFFNQSGSELTVAWNSVLDFPGDFTIELYVWLAPTPLDNFPIIYERGTGGANHGIIFNYVAVAPNIVPVFFYGSPRQFVDIATSVSAETWYHIAVTRSAGTVRGFAEGVLAASAAVANDFTESANLVIGRASGSSFNSFRGYIDDLRITKGVARYTANFTPPTGPFPTS